MTHEETEPMKAARLQYAADLDGMPDDEIDSEISSVSQIIDEETSWLEALTAEKEHRSRVGAATVFDHGPDGGPDQST